jgi:hypothetical protein
VHQGRGEDAVAHEVLDHAAPGQDDGDHGREIPVEQAGHVSGAEPLRHRREIAEIGKEYGHRDDLTLDDRVIEPDGLEGRSCATGFWILTQQMCAHDLLPSGDPGTNRGLAGRGTHHGGKNCTWRARVDSTSFHTLDPAAVETSAAFQLSNFER